MKKKIEGFFFRKAIKIYERLKNSSILLLETSVRESFESNGNRKVYWEKWMIANNNLVNPFQYSRAPLLFPFLFPSASAFQPRDLLPLKKGAHCGI